MAIFARPVHAERLVSGARPMPSLRASSGLRPIAPDGTAAMARMAISSALKAIGVLVVLLLVGVWLFVPHVSDSIARVGAGFAASDDGLRRDALRDLGFELTLAWALMFVAILWWRGGVVRALCRVMCRAPKIATPRQFLGDLNGR